MVYCPECIVSLRHTWMCKKCNYNSTYNKNQVCDYCITLQLENGQCKSCLKIPCEICGIWIPADHYCRMCVI